jgi:hypothetical protein
MYNMFINQKWNEAVDQNGFSACQLMLHNIPWSTSNIIPIYSAFTNIERAPVFGVRTGVRSLLTVHLSPRLVRRLETTLQSTKFTEKERNIFNIIAHSGFVKQI